MSNFKQKVLQVVSAIPYGKVASYGQVALYVGFPRGARQVGWILSATDQDPNINIPWWRVINNKGRISIKGNMHSDAQTQRKYLASEGILVDADFNIDIEAYRWLPSEKELETFELSDNYATQLISKYKI